MNWLALLENVGIFGIASGLLAWLIKNLVTHSLSRELEMFRAELKMAHAVQMEEAKNRFTVGAMSHMAVVAFDKHVEFCEEYSKAVRAALLNMLKKGPHEDVLKDAGTLTQLREKWSLWLSPEIERQLTDFEGAVRTIGAQGWLLRNLGPNENRSEAIKRAYGTFAAVMGWEEWRGEPVTKDLEADRVFEGLQKVLGIGQLTQLRSDLMKSAMTG